MNDGVNPIADIMNNLKESTERLKNQPNYNQMAVENLILLNSKMDRVIDLLEEIIKK